MYDRFSEELTPNLLPKMKRDSQYSLSVVISISDIMPIIPMTNDIANVIFRPNYLKITPLNIYAKNSEILETMLFIYKLPLIYFSS